MRGAWRGEEVEETAEGEGDGGPVPAAAGGEEGEQGVRLRRGALPLRLRPRPCARVGEHSVADLRQALVHNVPARAGRAVCKLVPGQGGARRERGLLAALGSDRCHIPGLVEGTGAILLHSYLLPRLLLLLLLRPLLHTVAGDPHPRRSALDVALAHHANVLVLPLLLFLSRERLGGWTLCSVAARFGPRNPHGRNGVAARVLLTRSGQRGESGSEGGALQPGAQGRVARAGRALHEGAHRVRAAAQQHRVRAVGLGSAAGQGVPAPRHTGGRGARV